MKRQLLRMLRLTSCAMAVGTAQAETIEVHVDVVGVRSDRGTVRAALHDTRQGFPSQWQRAVAAASKPATRGPISLSLKIPTAGRYALIVVHDEDDNGQMSKNLLGLPREGYATGRNATSLEFPNFESARLDWGPGTRASVQLLYP